MKLDLQAYCGYFQMCVKNGPCVELLLKVCRILALDSHGSCLLSSLELLFGGLRIWAPWDYGDCSPLVSGFCTPILCIIFGSLWTGLVLSYPELFRWSLLTGFCTPLLYIRKMIAIDRLQYSYSLYHLGGRYWQVSALPGFSFSLLPWWSLLTGICTLILCIILVIVIDRFLLSYSVLFKRSLWTGFCTLFVLGK